MRFLPVLLLAGTALAADSSSDTTRLIHWVLDAGGEFRDVPFADVLGAATGRKVVPIDPAADAAWLAQLATVLDETTTALNSPSHPIRSAGRINEASRFIEDEIRTRISALPGWECHVPRTTAGGGQRSGYPDLEITLPDGSTVYLDPKLYVEGSQRSSFRTFYYEPKTLTNKVHRDGRHLLVGIAHNGKDGTALRITGWKLVDVSKLHVRLKAEFQASNRDIYDDGNIVGSSRPAE